MLTLKGEHLYKKTLEKMVKKYYYFYVNYLTHAGVAQLAAHFTRNEGVGGSNPLTSISHLGKYPSLVEGDALEMR